jgi:hypothetical protein
MINMAHSEEDKIKAEGKSIISDSPLYPYGLSINLGPEEVEKLGLGIPGVGDKLMMIAKVEVSSVSNERTWGEKGKARITLQITDMDVQKPKAEKSAEQVIYGKE